MEIVWNCQFGKRTFEWFQRFHLILQKKTKLRQGKLPAIFSERILRKHSPANTSSDFCFIFLKTQWWPLLETCKQQISEDCNLSSTIHLKILYFVLKGACVNVQNRSIQFYKKYIKNSKFLLVTISTIVYPFHSKYRSFLASKKYNWLRACRRKEHGRSERKGHNHGKSKYLTTSSAYYLHLVNQMWSRHYKWGKCQTFPGRG